MEYMEKPVSMIIEETKHELANVINNCKLHPAIIEMIVKEIYVEVCQINAANAIKEKEEYLKESTEE